MPTMKHQSDAEAVLSSVRRLVSEETARGVSQGASGVVEKLLLTPAFRVDGPSSAPDTQPSSSRRVPSELELRIAELERAVGGQPGQWEPDGSEAVDEETPKEFVFRHGAAQASAPAPEPQLDLLADEDERETEAQAARTLDATEISEDQLREMVARMVRDELQGELGERITRNVRKLVRSEIHRAFLMRDIRQRG